MSDLLVLGPLGWRDVLDPFVRYKNDTAMSAELMTLEQIESAYQGRDSPERIKRAIEARHRMGGVKYVLLAGDADCFPVRYIRATHTEWGTRWYPSDLYYMDLYDAAGAFDTWDANHNLAIGEMDFTGQGLAGVNVDRINMVPDVAVGRVPASSASELSIYLNKVMDYEYAARQSTWANNPSNWAGKALLVVDGLSDAFGDEKLGGQYTAALSEAGIAMVHRYKDDPPWSGATDAVCEAELMRLLDEGAGFLYFFGHGNRASFSQWLTRADVGRLRNDLKLPVVFALACLTAEFQPDMNAYLTAAGSNWSGTSVHYPEPAAVQPPQHDRDSMAEEFLVKRASGAVAYIGATCKYEHGGKPLMQYFSEAYRDLPKPPAIGDMWRSALTRFACKDALQGMSWFAFLHLHKVMLFGDPSVRVGGLRPDYSLLPSPWVEVDQAILDQAAFG